MIGGEDLEDDGLFSSETWMMLHPTAASFPAFELNQTDHPKKSRQRLFFSPPLSSLLNALHVLSARWMLQIRLTRFREASPSAGQGPAPQDHGSPASAEALVLVLEVVQPLGEEHHDHEEEEEHQRGHAHHHAQHLELGDGPVAARTLVPDVVLHVAPAHGRLGRGVGVGVGGCIRVRGSSAREKTLYVAVSGTFRAEKPERAASVSSQASCDLKPLMRSKDQDT